MKTNRQPQWFPGLSACMGVVALCLSCGAQEGPVKLPKELDNLKFEYEVMLAEINKPLDALSASYRNRLKSISEDLQKQADLDGVVAVRKEIEALSETGNSVPPSESSKDPPALVSAREIFQRERTKLGEQGGEKAAVLLLAYRKRIEKLIAEYTRQGRLDDAVASKNHLAGVPEEPAGRSLEPAPRQDRKKELKIKVQMDGVSYLLIRGHEIWFDHTKGAWTAPGRHEGEFPTYLDDDIEWHPVWNGKVTERFDAGIDLPAEEPAARISLSFRKGRGTAEVIEQPSKGNDFTARIEMRDQSEEGKGFFGSDWMEFRLKW